MLDRRKPRVRSSDSNSPNPRIFTSPSWSVWQILICTIAVLLIVLGALIGRFWEEQIDKKFQQEMMLRATSEGVKEWTSPSIPIITKMYYWNWTNYMDIDNPDFKPILEEVGPYTYREVHEKVNLTWHDNGTVSYRQMKKWYFIPELSSGNLNDTIISVNVLLTAISARSDNWSGYYAVTASFMLTAASQKVYWKHTVSEFSFEGFKNPVQTLASLLTKMPDRFGFFVNMNGTVPNHVNTMSTGANDIYTLGSVTSYDYSNGTHIHEAPCSDYQGSLGELWPPHLSPNSILTMFVPDMCRSISYYFEKESSHNGIPTLVFSSNEKTVDNGTLVKENSCYCPESGCRASGVYDVRSCHDGPVLMSLPHFYLADPIYRDSVVGMNPDHEKHKFFLELEPKTGVPLKVAARVQLNVLIMNNPKFSKYSKLKEVVMPVWWMETIVSLPESHTSSIKLLLMVFFIGPFISATLITLGVSLILFLLAQQYYFKARCRRKDTNENEGEKCESLLQHKPKMMNGENVPLATLST